MGVARRESAEVRKGLEEALGDEHAAVLLAIHAEREAAERRIAELEFERVVRESAIYGGVLPRAVDFIIEDARRGCTTGLRATRGHSAAPA